MNSKELNEKIRLICDDTSLYESFGGKSIPYIGWFWRDVNFDTKEYYFGVLPVYKEELESNDKERLGFMENNKWDYHYHLCDDIDWADVKRLLEKAVMHPSRETLKAVDDKIQSLLED